VVLGVPPVLGHSFTPEEERQGLTAGVALISDAFWASPFGRRSDAIWSTLRLDGSRYTVIGSYRISVEPIRESLVGNRPAPLMSSPAVFSVQLGLGIPVIDRRVLGFTAFVSLASAAIE
jgi:hypothetical protein